MGISSYQKEVEALFQKSPVVDFKSIERLVHAKKRSVKQYTKLLVRNLLVKAKIKRLTKGHYSLVDDPSLFVFCMKPAYLGLQDALSAHHLWEQETIPVIITTQRVRQGMRQVFGANVLVHRMEQKYYFGIDYLPQGDFYFPYSDLEKTVVDMFYFKQALRKDVLHLVKKKIDRKKLKQYLSYYPKQFRRRVTQAIFS